MQPMPIHDTVSGPSCRFSIVSSLLEIGFVAPY
jgi:hypothetical protein